MRFFFSSDCEGIHTVANFTIILLLIYVRVLIIHIYIIDKMMNLYLLLY